MSAKLSIARRLWIAGALAAIALLAAAPRASARKGNRNSLAGKGSILISDTLPCTTGSDICYMVSCSFPPSRHDVSATCSGSGMTDPSTCKTKGKKTCCQTTMSLNFSVDKSGSEVGTFFAGFVGSICEKPVSNPTSEKVKGNLQATNGTGIFDGQTGTGKLSAKIDPNSGNGDVKARVHTK
jgi:hypothetical protein